MKCPEVEQKLVEDVCAAEEIEVAIHLRGCGACRSLREQLRALEELSSELRDQARAPESFVCEVLAQVRTHSRGIAGRWEVRAAGFAVLIVLSALAAGFWLSQGWETAASVQAGETGTEGIEWMAAPEPERFIGGENGYVDVILGESPEERFILRLPPVIEVRQTRLHDRAYFQNVSH